MLWWTCQIIQVSALTAIGVIGGLARVTPSEWPTAGKHLAAAQQHIWWLIITLPIVVGFAKAGAIWAGPPWVWKSLRQTLSQFRKHAFTNIDGEPEHHHRVTLFRKQWCWWIRPWRKGRWPWSGWMVPVARSGETTQSTNTIFLVPDDADKSEGIVGLVWQTRDVVQMSLPAVSDPPSLVELMQYATAARVPLQWVRHRCATGKPLPRTLCGIPVEVNNKLWGVLVLDSRKTGTIDYESNAWPAFTSMFPTAIVELLKRI